MKISRTFSGIMLGFIILLGGFFRLYHLNDESLWLDEGITYYNSSGESYSEVWDKTARLDQSPPGYYFLTHTYLETFGENEFGFRFISVIFSLLSVFFLYLLTAGMFGRMTGLFAAFLLAINPFHIGFSIEARMYVLLSLEALAGFYFLYKAMHAKKRDYIHWIVFTLFSIAGLYTHNFFIFVLLAFATIFFIFLIGNAKQGGAFLLRKFIFAVGSALIAGLAFLPWLPHFLEQLSVDRYWMAVNSFSDIKEYFKDFTNRNFYVLLGFLGLFVLSLWHFFDLKNKNYRKEIFALIALLCFLIIGLGVPFLYSLYEEPILKIRYIVYALPIFIAIVALGLGILNRIYFLIPITVGVIFVFLLNPWQMSAYPVEIGEDFRGLSEIVKDENMPLIVHSPSIKHVINFYNRGNFEIIPFPDSDDLREFNISEKNKEEFLNLIKNYDEFFLAVSHSHEDPYGLLKTWSDSVCSKKEVLQLEGMEAFKFSGC